jgi:hypothetical protein
VHLPHPCDGPRPTQREEIEEKFFDANGFPKAWGDVPSSAPISADIEWASGNRSLIVEKRNGKASVFHWERAATPPPSTFATDLIEYSDTNRKGFMDLVLKVKTATDDESEVDGMRRERKSLAEIENILVQLEGRK